MPGIQGEIVPALRKILVDEQAPLAKRFRALFALKAQGSAGNREAIDAIAAGFKDNSALLKHELAYVMGQTKNAYAAEYLQVVLQDETQDPMVRHEAAEGLGALAHQPSLSLLEQYLQDPLEVIRQTCELAIERIKWEITKHETQEKLKISDFSSIDPAPPLPKMKANAISEEVKKLQYTLNDRSLPLFHRYRAMFRLRDINTDDAVDALASGFKDPSALFRHEIAYVFGQLSSPRSVPALIKVLRNIDEEAMVRHEAAEALGSIATEEVLPVLREFCQDKERVVRESAIVALDSKYNVLPLY